MCDIINIRDWQRKKFEQMLAKYPEEPRPKLYINRQLGIITGSPKPGIELANNKIENVKRSIERINTLMNELRRLNNETAK